MSDAVLARSELTVANTDNRLPPRDEGETGERRAVQAANAVAAAAPRDEAPTCQPFLYEEVAPAARSVSPAPRVGSRADLHETDVEVVETDGVVREFVVICACGRRTRLRVDYGETP